MMGGEEGHAIKTSELLSHTGRTAVFSNHVTGRLSASKFTPDPCMPLLCCTGFSGVQSRASAESENYHCRAAPVRWGLEHCQGMQELQLNLCICFILGAWCIIGGYFVLVPFYCKGFFLI